MNQHNLILSDEQYKQNLERRQRRGRIGRAIFFLSNILALVMLIVLFLHVINSAFGYVIVENRVDPATLSETPLQELEKAELAQIFIDNASNRVLVFIRDKISQVDASVYTTAPIREVLDGFAYPEGTAELVIRDLTSEQQHFILTENFAQADILDAISDNIIQPTIITSWSLWDSLTKADAIKATAAEEYAHAVLEFKAWLNWDFIVSSVSSSATTAGLRTALLGSFWIISITAITALIIGVGAAIYLEEYASDNLLNKFIEINIRNLAAIPSVIYGMLGLAIFARALSFYTSGQFIGITDSNGRTVLSAGLTLALLILPLIIVNAQEAIRAVPSSIRDASYGLGATKLQTVFHQVLPVAIPGIMTGVILSLSRAIGETAPLLVVGASTFIGVDPNGLFSKFTVVPIQIFQWTSRPELVFKNVAAAAIIVLLIVMILMNAAAILIRNRYSVRY
jgi:phosphate transport system permease protein